MGRRDGVVTIHVAKTDLMSVSRSLLSQPGLRDFTVLDPPLADVIKHVYRHGVDDQSQLKGPVREWRRPPG
jgi:hypothetical protein